VKLCNRTDCDQAAGCVLNVATGYLSPVEGQEYFPHEETAPGPPPWLSPEAAAVHVDECPFFTFWTPMVAERLREQQARELETGHGG
jgi:hypothetical protein